MAKIKATCPTLSLLHILGKRWTIPIIETLYASKGTMQFNAMQSILYGITPKNLSRSLTELVGAEMIEKMVSRNGNTYNTRYVLTQKGAAFERLVQSSKELGVCLYNLDASCVNRQCNDCQLARS